jgi:hypothetical protein
LEIVTVPVTGAEFVAEVRRFLGRPYVYGADGPNSFDCSGLIYYSAHQLGLNKCPRTSEEQFAWCKRVQTPSAGDLVFFVGAENDPPPGHVGVVTAPGRMIDAPHTGTVVQEASFTTSGSGVDEFMGYGRMPDMTGSPSSNASLIRPGKSSSDRTAGIIGVIGGLILVGAIIIVVVAAFALLIAAGVIFR